MLECDEYCGKIRAGERNQECGKRVFCNIKYGGQVELFEEENLSNNLKDVGESSIWKCGERKV